MTIESALEKLFSLHQFGIKLGLEKIIELLNFIGNPHEKLKAIHIAGSNGKGSTASFIASILMETGYKTGLYTSPHYVKFNERIRINGSMIDDQYICEFMNPLNSYIDQNNPTFFELTTAMAFKYFAENDIDYAVIETGLGGRLDATNVLKSICSVITTISIEHSNILGTQPEQIAWEKACIIKPNTKVFAGIMSKEASHVIRNYSAERGCEIIFLTERIVENCDYVSVTTNFEQFNIYRTPLPGKYQLTNAALAILAVSNVFENINKQAVFRGIDMVVENTGIQGRYEIFNKNPTVIFDSSHNPEGIDAFLNEFSKHSNQYSKKTIIFGVMRDKDYKRMIEKISVNFDYLFAVKINYERSAEPKALIAYAHSLGIRMNNLADPVKFIKDFILENKDSQSCLVILGSIYLIGEIKSRLIDNLT